VKLHRNAKTTPHMRALLTHRTRRLGWSVGAAAAAAGISVRSAHKWLARYRAEGRRGLLDRSSAPHHRPHQTSDPMRARIIAARYQRKTAWAIAVQLQVPRSTVAAILARVGLNRLARLTPLPPVQRYEHPYPGALVHLDIKPLGRIERIGHRIHGDQGQRVKGAGYEFAHVAIDDYSRVAYVEVLRDQRGPTVAGFLERTVRWFAARGVRIQRILTDNGAGYCSNPFAAVVRYAGLRHRWCRPYRPQTNGKAERFIQTLQREWAYGKPYRTSALRTRALAPWLRYYNTRRPHTALGYQPPAARFPRAAQ
jgi:transposase InsO family protein